MVEVPNTHKHKCKLYVTRDNLEKYNKLKEELDHMVIYDTYIAKREIFMGQGEYGTQKKLATQRKMSELVYMYSQKHEWTKN